MGLVTLGGLQVGIGGHLAVGGLHVDWTLGIKPRTFCLEPLTCTPGPQFIPSGGV